jgi:signal transduction histidine kinase
MDPHRNRVAPTVRAVPRRDSQRFLRRLNAGLEHQARAIGQSLHDEAGQLLTAAYIALDEASRALPKAARDRLRLVRQHLEAVEEHLRHVAYELRPRVLDDLGLIPALEFLAHGFETRLNVSTTVHAATTRALPDSIETAVYRVAQEGLTNIGRHAHATRASIRLAIEAGRLRCTIRDDGVGFDPTEVRKRPSAGLGLRGIRDRLAIVGGRLRIESGRGVGTTLIATIPLER